MKRKRYAISLVFLLLIFALYSCQRTENNQMNAYVDAYKAVLTDKSAFFSTDDKKDINLNELLSSKFPGTALTVTRFTVLDLDGDKVPEVVLELSADNDPLCFEVLKYMDKNNTVVGYNFVYRALLQLKTDGSFHFSSGAADVGYGKLSFTSEASEINTLGYTESSFKDGVLSISYFVDQKPVSEEAFKAFSKEQDEKADVVWHEFTPQSIEAELAADKK